MYKDVQLDIQINQTMVVSFKTFMNYNYSRHHQFRNLASAVSPDILSRQPISNICPQYFENHMIDDDTVYGNL